MRRNSFSFKSVSCFPDVSFALTCCHLACQQSVVMLLYDYSFLGPCNWVPRIVVVGFGLRLHFKVGLIMYKYFIVTDQDLHLGLLESPSRLLLSFGCVPSRSITLVHILLSVAWLLSVYKASSRDICPMALLLCLILFVRAWFSICVNLSPR